MQKGFYCVLSLIIFVCTVSPPWITWLSNTLALTPTFELGVVPLDPVSLATAVHSASASATGFGYLDGKIKNTKEEAGLSSVPEPVKPCVYALAHSNYHRKTVFVVNASLNAKRELNSSDVSFPAVPTDLKELRQGLFKSNRYF